VVAKAQGKPVRERRARERAGRAKGGDCRRVVRCAEMFDRESEGGRLVLNVCFGM
jgi:hypothetical protein